MILTLYPLNKHTLCNWNNERMYNINKEHPVAAE
jgi:hypothetical protein